MDDQIDQEPSYDPRSWLGPAKADPDTLDPRAWGKGNPTPPPRPATPEKRAAHPYNIWVIALSAALGIALAGAIVAFLSRPRNGVPTPPPPIAARQAPVGGGGESSTVLETRSLLVPSAADVGTSLVAVGVTADQADSAMKAIAPRLNDAGEIKLDFVLEPTSKGPMLRDLTATRDDGSGVQLTAGSHGQFGVSTIAAKLALKVRFVRGELDGESFYSSAVGAGVTDVLVGEFANAFRYDFDMQREIAKGDVFEAGYQQRINADGAPVGLPTLVYASLSTAAKSRTLYRFQPPGVAEAEWFDSTGRSARRALMRTPVEASRISSGFGMRLHPILGFMKLHAGTDFAAPTGTPIFAAGDGVVIWAGPKGPNGNFTKIRHDNGWETLYLHQSRILPGIVVGARVAQGQQIGAVGMTGRATGPHLHFEVHIDGKPVDPMSIDTSTSRTLTGAALTAFRKQRDRIDASRTHD